MGALPTSSAAIDTTWLNQVLGDEVRGGAQIAAVEAEVIGEGVGFLGEVARLTLTYDAPAPGAVRSMISKVPTTNEGFKHLGLLLGLYAKEHGFYKEIAPEMELRVPECYFNGADGEATDFVLLLEDLGHMRPGNQLASCSRDEAVLALDTAARLHARWWDHPRLADFASWLPSPGSPYFEILKAAYAGGFEKLHAVFGHLLTPEIEALAERALGEYDLFIDCGGGRRPHTFIHGDFRLDNMMFGDADSPFALLDWQLPFCANPLWDVVYFLAGNFEPVWRAQHQEELVAGYHAVLVDAGVEGYSFEDCWRDYRAAALVLIGYVVTSAADVDLDTLNDRGRELLETMFHRYAAAVSDLDAAAFLD